MMGRHRRKRTTSTADYDAMLIRMIRAYHKRVRQDPDVALADLRAIESELTDAVNLGLHEALSDGRSPTQLADMLGVSRQAIYKRAGLGGQVARQRDRGRAIPTARVAKPRELPASERLSAAARQKAFLSVTPTSEHERE
jgi:hypothetical protein